MPIHKNFKKRLYPNLKKIADHYGTPFHIYDRQGIKKTCQELASRFSETGNFCEFYAVKALPNPEILNIMTESGFGFDCSSIAELILARNAGGKPETIMFTSNNTSSDDFQEAMDKGGCILNLDDISLFSKLPEIPEILSFRYNPGSRRDGNAIIGKPEEAKYGISHDQFLDAYKLARDNGVKRFGLHCMLASNELNYTYMVETAQMQLNLIQELYETLEIQVEFINIGGGLGIPYRPDENPLDIESMSIEITSLFKAFRKKNGIYAQSIHGKRKVCYRTSWSPCHKSD